MNRDVSSTLSIMNRRCYFMFHSSEMHKRKRNKLLTAGNDLKPQTDPGSGDVVENKQESDIWRSPRQNGNNEGFSTVCEMCQDEMCHGDVAKLHILKCEVLFFSFRRGPWQQTSDSMTVGSGSDLRIWHRLGRRWIVTRRADGAAQRHDEAER
ncbi:hypothetical protein F2P81_003124 [Scophthalmus maximus]|uniref:Uncharacterized protein n=1 Tax=Scophthalmus maximus TaxID=52904 RepID=A0A6A4T8T1_SCOMX|nr:hypothetical protein F2P81_003124 [Scophthalmus maximus]